MKKVKIMLMAVAVVAVTGGLVAAKVNRTTQFCTTTVTLFGGCPSSVSGTIVRGAIGSGTKVCTSALVAQNCPTSGYLTTLTTVD